MTQRLHELFSYSNGAAKYLGTFDSANLAQAAYAAAAKQNFKEFARV